MPSHSTHLPRSTDDSSTGSKVSDAFMTYFRKHGEEKCMWKDVEIDRLHAENIRMKRERVDQVAEKNIADLHLDVLDAMRRTR